MTAAEEEQNQQTLLMRAIDVARQEASVITQHMSTVEAQLSHTKNDLLPQLYRLAWSELLDACMAKARGDAKQPANPHDEGAETVAVWAPQAVSAKLLGKLTAEDLVTLWGNKEGDLCDSRPPAGFIATSIHDQRDAVLSMPDHPTFHSLLRIFFYVHSEAVGTAADAELSRADSDETRLEAWFAYKRAVADAEAQLAAREAVEAALKGITIAHS